MLDVLWLFLFFVGTVTATPYSKGGARTRFESRFEKCKKYSFYQHYIDSVNKPRDRHLIYVFHDQELGSNGGLGDRLAGLVTGFAYAMRTNRTFLIYGDQTFENAFHPYQPPEIASKINWNDWSWSGLDKSAYHTTPEFNGFVHCVNPRVGQVKCGLDRDLPPTVLKYRCNRSYLCRWATKPDVVDPKELADTLGIDGDSDLFEVAGCMLRLVMWPTEELWQTADEIIPTDPKAARITSFETSSQVGFHFRCGDSSFSADASTPTNPQCVFQSKETWKGTLFSDDLTFDSPVDSAVCGKALLQNITASGHSRDVGKALAIVASDYHKSALQIRANLNWPYTIIPPQSCHVDNVNPKCPITTYAHWLLLALSDYIVMQAMDTAGVMPNSPYKERPRVGVPEQAAPISAFSRFAAIYSLSPGVIRYGSKCEGVDQYLLSRQTQGNWVCNPKLFF